MQTAPFVELLAVPSALAKNPLFDIIVEDKIGKTGQIDHPIPVQIDHQFRSKLTTLFQFKLTT